MVAKTRQGSKSGANRRRRPVAGTALLRYSAERGWSDEMLARFLGCDAFGLARLALERCPETSVDDRDTWAVALATETGCIPDRLVAVLRAEGWAAR